VRLFQALRQLYGRKSEKVSSDQLQLFLDQIVVDVPKDAAKPQTEIPKRKPRPRGGRKPLPENLPREPYIIPVPDRARRCEECGAEKKTIGYVDSEILEFRPAHFVILVPRREKVACPKCEAHISISDDDKLIERGRPGPGLVADIIVGKFQDGLPIERQADRYKRCSVDLAPSTLGDWSAWGLQTLASVARRIAQLVLADSYIQADDTTLKVLDPAKKPAVKRGHLWAFVGMTVKLTSFLYAPNWASEHPAEFLRTFNGDLQGDGYAGFDHMLEPPDDDIDPVVAADRRLGCGMHIRRRFEQAAQLGDARGAIALSLFRKIYAIEEACKTEGLSVEQRLIRRQSESAPVVAELYAWIDKIHSTLVPKSPIYQATHYAIRQKKFWLRCFSDGKFEIDNGEVERQLRRVATGRKNYLFAGSDEGAVRIAIAYTILATCRMHGVNPLAYLTDVLRKLADGWPNTQLDELLPHRWVAPTAT
jgi:transposase